LYMRSTRVPWRNVAEGSALLLLVVGRARQYGGTTCPIHKLQ
jgi:hypothetical protein